jgi:hypothetical protein
MKGGQPVSQQLHKIPVQQQDPLIFLIAHEHFKEVGAQPVRPWPHPNME